MQEASARETFFGFIAYKTLYLRRTDNEFEALPNKQSAFSTIPECFVVLCTGAGGPEPEF